MTVEEFAEALASELADALPLPPIPSHLEHMQHRRVAGIKNLLLQFCIRQRIAGFATNEPAGPGDPPQLEATPPHLYRRIAILWRELKREQCPACLGTGQQKDRITPCELCKGKKPAGQDTRIATNRDSEAKDLMVYATGPAADHLLAMLTALEQLGDSMVFNRAPKA